MVAPNAARNAVGIIGNVISFCLFLSPSPTFCKIWKRGAVEQYSPYPYLATFNNCMQWFLYGLPFVTPNSVLVLTINGIGFAMESMYISLYLAFATKKQSVRVLKILIAQIAFFSLVVALVMTLVHEPKKRSLIVGSLCVIFGTLMYAAPLSVMKMVIQTKSVKYMPFSIALANFLNGLCWTVYALLRFDLFVLIPNVLGTIFSVIQLLLYGCYYRTTVWDDGDGDKCQSDLQLPTRSQRTA